MLNQRFPGIFLAERKITKLRSTFTRRLTHHCSVLLTGTNRPPSRAVAQEVTSPFGFLRLKEWPVPHSSALTAFWAMAFLHTRKRKQKREKTIIPAPRFRKWCLLWKLTAPTRLSISKCFNELCWFFFSRCCFRYIINQIGWILKPFGLLSAVCLWYMKDLPKVKKKKIKNCPLQPNRT